MRPEAILSSQATKAMAELGGHSGSAVAPVQGTPRGCHAAWAARGGPCESQGGHVKWKVLLQSIQGQGQGQAGEPRLPAAEDGCLVYYRHVNEVTSGCPFP